MNSTALVCPNAPGVFTPLVTNPGGALNCTVGTNADGGWYLRWWISPDGLSAVLDVLCLQDGVLCVAGDHGLSRGCLSAPWVDNGRQDYSPYPKLAPQALTPGRCWNYQDAGSWMLYDGAGNVTGSGTYTHGSVGSYGGGLLTFHETEIDVHLQPRNGVPPSPYDRQEFFSPTSGLFLIVDNLANVQYVTKGWMGK